mmetsp:Transcript_22710/g.90968  ORF Transcript_22710/g.90968 Transcript_22710/m.90968 type:complete len:115 (-) Transcript_22710:163-507(-)
MAKKTGKLLPKGEPNHDATARKVLHDFIRGRLPWFVTPPDPREAESEERDAAEATVDQDLSKLRSSEQFDRESDPSLAVSQVSKSDTQRTLNPNNGAADLEWDASDEDGLEEKS